MKYLGLVLYSYLTTTVRQKNCNGSRKCSNLMLPMRQLTFRNKENIIFASTQKYVFRLGCVDYDALFIGEPFREILTRVKEHLNYTR